LEKKESTMSFMRSFFLTLSRSKRMHEVATRFGLAKAMAHRFVAGETLKEAIATVQRLNEQGLLGTLDHLGENVSSEAQAHAAADEVLELLNAIETRGVQSGVSIKLTQMGLDVRPALAAENVERIVARAAEAGRFVRIDMESFDYVQPTLNLFETLWARYKNVGLVIQSYLYRSAGDVAHLVELGAFVRLVKGAYDESPEVAYPRKADTDDNFIRLIKVLFGDEARSNSVFPAIATHDTRLIDWTKAHVRHQGIPLDQFEFQMLYGIRSRLQRQLVAEGYRVRTYVPYGNRWYPYFMRRLAERPANVFFLLRNLLRT
jgi:proline dehydrogenase